MKRAPDLVLGEDVPDGTFGGARNQPRDTRPVPWTPAEQAQHRADLNAALRGWRDPSEQAARDRERHRPRPRRTRPTSQERTAA